MEKLTSAFFFRTIAHSECEHINENDLLPSEPADIYGEVEIFRKEPTGHVRKRERNAEDDATLTSEVPEETLARKTRE